VLRVIQLLCNHLPHGYWFYVGWMPADKDRQAVDAADCKYEVGLSRAVVAGGNGLWQITGPAAMWNPAVVPNNGTDTYNVFIDGGVQHRLVGVA
jgi:hypothetical protein